MTIHLPLCGCF